MSRSGRSLVRPAVRLAPTVVQRCVYKLRARPVHGYIGWLGRGNLGDEAAFAGIKRLRPDIAWAPATHLGRAFRLACAVGLDGPKFYRSVALGGGTLINPGMFRLWVRELLRAGQSMWCCGTGVGSSGWKFDVDPDLAAWSSLLAEFKGIGVRGPKSKEQLESIGAQHVEVCGDLALALARDQLSDLDEPRTLAINVSLPTRSGDPVDGENLMNTLVSVARRWCGRGGRILPLALDREDIAPLTDFARLANLDGTRVLFPLDPVHVIEKIAGCAAVVGVRLHSAVLACCAGVPCVLLAYRPKCLDFMLSMGLQEANIDLLQAKPGSIENRIESLIARPPLERTEILAVAKRWANVQKTFVDRMLGVKAPRNK